MLCGNHNRVYANRFHVIVIFNRHLAFGIGTQVRHFFAFASYFGQYTQDFVAETIGVSRQAVSKWENGTSEPNTSNLMALARLYGIPAEDLLKGVERALEAQEK